MDNAAGEDGHDCSQVQRVPTARIATNARLRIICAPLLTYEKRYHTLLLFATRIGGLSMADRVVGFRLGDDVIEALDVYAAATVRNRSQVIEVAIRAFLASPEVAATLQAQREKNPAVVG